LDPQAQKSFETLLVYGSHCFLPKGLVVFLIGPLFYFIFNAEEEGFERRFAL
jgi:hypothetical protein